MIDHTLRLMPSLHAPLNSPHTRRTHTHARGPMLIHKNGTEAGVPTSAL
jgi:hypothetical protein